MEEFLDNVENIIHEIMSTSIENQGSALDDFIERVSSKELNGEVEKVLEIIINLEDENFSRYDKELTFEKIVRSLPRETLKDKIEAIIRMIALSDEEIFNITSKKLMIVNIVEELEDDILTEKLGDIVNIILNVKMNILLDFDKKYIIEGIIEILPQKYLEENIKKILEINQGKYDIYDGLIEKILNSKRVSILKEIPADKLAKYVNYENLPKWADVLGEILSDSSNIVQDDLVMYIFDLFQRIVINSTDIERKKIEKIKSEFEKYGSSYTMPNMEAFDSKVSNFEKMDEDEFERFIKNIEILKIKTGRIPEKYCDYIIRQKLISGEKKEGNIYSGFKQETDIDKYLYIFKRAFEDKTLHILEKEGIFGYKVEFAELDGSIAGENSDYDKVIRYKLDGLRDLNIEQTGLINTMFHEVEHAKQYACIVSKDIERIDSIKYNIIKEGLVKKVDLGFYKSNYQRMYEEIGARIEGSREQSKYLEYLGFSPEQIILADKTKLKDCFEKVREIEAQNLKKAQNKVGKEAEIISVSQKFMEIFEEQDPNEIRKILEQFPVLQLEFEEDGKRKTIAKMFEEINSKKLSEAEISIYMEIFRENIHTDFKILAKDLKSVLEYKKYTNIDSTLMNNFIEQIVKNQIFSTLDFYATEDVVLNELLNILSKFATENSQLDVSSWILRQINKYRAIGVLKHGDNVAEEDEKLKQIVDKRKMEMYLSISKIKTLEEFASVIDGVILQGFGEFNLRVVIQRLLRDKVDYGNIKKEEIIECILNVQQMDSITKWGIVSFIIKNMTIEEKNVESIMKIILDPNIQNFENFLRKDIIRNMVKDMTIEEQQANADIDDTSSNKKYDDDGR